MTDYLSQLGAGDCETIIEASMTGFHEIGGTKVCVTPIGEVIGLPADNTTLIELNAEAGAADRNKAGTLEGQLAAQAAALTHPENNHWGMGVMAGCGGPVMQLLNQNTRLLSFVSDSSNGKTTALAFLCAAFSNPEDGKGGLTELDSTMVGLEGLLMKSQGAPMGFDEAHRFPKQEFGRALWKITGGTDKHRGKLSRGNRERGDRIITLGAMACETGVEAILKEAAGSRGISEMREGLKVRVLEIDCDSFKDIGADYVNIKPLWRNYGHTGPIVVQALFDRGYVDDVDRVRRAIEAIVTRR